MCSALDAIPATPSLNESNNIRRGVKKHHYNVMYMYINMYSHVKYSPRDVALSPEEVQAHFGHRFQSGLQVGVGARADVEAERRSRKAGARRHLNTGRVQESLVCGRRADEWRLVAAVRKSVG